jgi:hypothetical protein
MKDLVVRMQFGAFEQDTRRGCLSNTGSLCLRRAARMAKTSSQLSETGGIQESKRL